MTNWRLYQLIISATVALSSAACAAKEPAYYVEREVITLPYPGGIDAKRLKQSYKDTVDLLKKRAAEETRNPDYEPQVGSYAVYPIGDARPWVIFGAVTPRKGVFYAIPYGHYASLDDYRNGRIEQLNGKIDVCRMEVRWDRLPGGPFAPGIDWAGMYMSGVECQPPPIDQLAMLDEWKNRAGKPDYAIEGKVSERPINVTLIREVPPKGSAYRPFDAVAASAKLMETGDKVIWAIPLVDDVRTASVVATRRGRLLAYIFDEFAARDFHDLMCVAEGLSWSDIAIEPSSPSMQAASRICRDLTTQYRDRRNTEMRRVSEGLPPPLSRPATLEE